MNYSGLRALPRALTIAVVMLLLAGCAAVDPLDPTAPQNKKYVIVAAGDSADAKQHAARPTGL